MKNKLFISFTMISVLALSMACKKNTYLDNTTTDILTQQKVFSDSVKTSQFLNNIYAYLGQDIIPLRANCINSGKGNDYACLEELTTQSTSYYSDPQASWLQGLNTSKDAPFYKYYAQYYTLIRSCNMYMQQVQNAPLTQATKVQTAAEARFLRAWYYAELVRVFGSVMLVGDIPYDISASINYKRNTYKECIDYIVKQCDTAAMNLPAATTQDPTNYGRITSGACLALKARMLLTAASPLFNGSPITNDPNLQPLLCYSATYDPSLWQKAADAFQAVVTTGQYNLYVDNSIPGNGFRQLFLMRQNNEYILPFMLAPGHDIETMHFPLSRSSGGGYSNPSQNLVDQFGMSNGRSINDPSSGYDPNNPYINRDPRFYHTIIFNQGKLYNPTTQKMDVVNIYSTNNSGIISPYQDGVKTYQTKTGYYCNKMANDSVSQSTNENRVYPLIRYAEILLGEAEALNELNGPTSDVYNYIKTIRNRAGISAGADGNYGLKQGMSKADMRAVIQNEYRTELAYEGHWFYDSRRWRLAETEEKKPVQGMLIVKQSNGTFTYTRFSAPLTGPLTVIFLPSMYFHPFPLAEISKSLAFYQNPGW
jgi:hypothetical protein